MQFIFEDKLIFHPRLVTFECPTPYCTQEEKDTYCVADGKYCTLFPISFNTSDLTPQMIVD